MFQGIIVPSSLESSSPQWESFPFFLDCLILKTRALQSFKIWGITHPTTQCHLNLKQHCCENLTQYFLSTKFWEHLNPSVHLWHYSPFWTLAALRRRLYYSLSLCVVSTTLILGSLKCPSGRHSPVLFLVFHLPSTMKFPIKNLEHLNTLTKHDGSLLPCYHFTLLPTHSDTFEYQYKFRWYGKSWCMEQKKWALKLPSVNCVMSVFSLSPNFLFFWILHLPSHWTVSSGNSFHIFTTHFWDTFWFPPRYQYLSTEVLCAVLVFPIHILCTTPIAIVYPLLSWNRVTGRTADHLT